MKKYLSLFHYFLRPQDIVVLTPYVFLLIDFLCCGVYCMFITCCVQFVYI